MEDYELCLDRYNGARIARSLCVELGWGSTLNPREAGVLIERLLRHAVGGVDSYSEELKNADRAWQVLKMFDCQFVSAHA